jgi:sugar phosphate isomerase/epimerase
MSELFPTAESVMELVGDLDKRIGLCLDIGHEFRAGKDPIHAASVFAERLYDVHLKNVTAPDKAGRGIELPRGAIDLLAFTGTLRKIGYSDVCSLEYEKDMENPLPGIAECVGYFRGLMDATRPRA